MIEILNLTESKKIKLMKLFFFFIPISILSFKILLLFYPNTFFYFSYNIKNMDIKLSITYFFIYCLLTAFVLLFQKLLLPMYLMNNIKPFKNQKLFQDLAEIKMQNFSNENIYNTWTKENPAIKFYHLLTYICTTLIIWFLCLNSIIVVLPIILILLCTYLMGKIINTLLVRNNM